MFDVWKTEINKWNEMIFWKTNTWYSIIEEYMNKYRNIYK